MSQDAEVLPGAETASASRAGARVLFAATTNDGPVSSAKRASGWAGGLVLESRAHYSPVVVIAAVWAASSSTARTKQPDASELSSNSSGSALARREK